MNTTSQKEKITAEEKREKKRKYAREIKGETVSNTMKRKLLKISELDEKSDTYFSKQLTRFAICGILYKVVNEILFVGHGTTADSRDLSVFVGQNRAKCGFGDGRVLRFYYD